MMRKICLLIVVFILFIFEAKAQGNLCNNSSLDGYIIDGQEYVLNIEDSNSGKIFMSFFDGYVYRLYICSETTKKYKINLFDIEKKILFSGSCEDYVKNLDLKFASNIACYAEITISEPKPKQQFKVVIGFKDSSSSK